MPASRPDTSDASPPPRDAVAWARAHVQSGARWEAAVGYARAVRVGPFVYVSGTTATDAEGRVVGDAYEQTRRALGNLRGALEQAGARLEDVVRTRLFVTDIQSWEAVGRAHGEVFGTIRPATSMVEVARLIDPAMRVEVEADAVVRAPAGEASSGLGRTIRPTRP